MSIFKNLFFIVCCLLFWANQYLERVQGIFIPFLHEYLDDLLAMPVVLGLTLQIMRWFHQQKDQYVFTKLQIAIAVIYFSLIFEVFLPMKSATYTRDWWDVLCYAIGAVAFHYLINKAETSPKKVKME